MQQFASQPQPVGARQKYRDDGMDATGKNIMHDRRVVRGNTYASLVMPQNDAQEVQKQREAQRRRLMRANQTKHRPGTPEPVIGRKHMDIQTDSYLEELTERTVEFEAETQTDFLLDRPPSPLFMPAKVGVDIETQIEEGELFDFDREVEPVLEVLVGKTLEQSMMEVLEEEELESIRRHQEEFEQLRNAELLEVQRMEAAEKRRADELERRMQQEKARLEQESSLMQKVVSRNIAFEYLGPLNRRALQQLLDAGIFQDTVQVAVDGHFLPNLMDMVTDQLKKQRRNAQLAEEVTKASVKGKLAAHREVLNKEKARIQALDDIERKARADEELAAQLAKEEAERIREERQAMMDWEDKVPEPEPAIRILAVDGEKGEAQLADERVAVVSEAQMADLAAAFAGLTETQAMMCRVDEGAETLAITEFFIEELAPADADGGEAPAADDQ